MSVCMSYASIIFLHKLRLINNFTGFHLFLNRANSLPFDADMLLLVNILIRFLDE